MIHAKDSLLTVCATVSSLDFLGFEKTRLEQHLQELSMAAGTVAATFSSVAITNCCDVAWRYKKNTDHGGEAKVENRYGRLQNSEVCSSRHGAIQLFIHHFQDDFFPVYWNRKPFLGIP